MSPETARSEAGPDGSAAGSSLDRLRSWWRGVTFASEDPGRRVAALGFLGAFSGLAEAALVVLIVAMASGSSSEELAVVGDLPSDAALLAALSIAVLVLLALAHLGSALITARAASDAMRIVQTMLIDAYLGAPWIRQAATRSGELQDVVTNKAMILAHGTQEAATGLTALLSVVVLTGVAIAVSPWVALVLVMTLALALLIGRPFRSHRRRISDEIVDSSGGLAVEVAETSQATRDLRVFGVAGPARRQLLDSIAANAKNLKALEFTGLAVPAITRHATLALIVVALALVVGAGDVSLPVLGAVVLLMLRALTHAQSLSSLSYVLAEREANLALIRRRVDEWSQLEARGSRPCHRVDRVELDRVSYRYPGAERLALEDVSLLLTRGERLGVAGRTGAGKSTLAALLLGLIPPDRGQIRIDGAPLQELSPADWNRRTAWIGQEPHLLTGTVAENIRFMRAGLDDEAVERAALAAALGPELEQWPDGVEHQVGPSGIAISGGQRQRIALARALAGNPDLLVLDEPTSALDARTEAALRETLGRLEEAIVVVIAHRSTTIESCDRVLFIEDGRVDATVAPGELAAAGPSLDLDLESPRPAG